MEINALFGQPVQFLDGGSHEGHRLLDQETVEAMTIDQLPFASATWGLGWDLWDTSDLDAS